MKSILWTKGSSEEDESRLRRYGSAPLDESRLRMKSFALWFTKLFTPSATHVFIRFIVKDSLLVLSCIKTHEFVKNIHNFMNLMKCTMCNNFLASVCFQKGPLPTYRHFKSLSPRSSERIGVFRLRRGHQKMFFVFFLWNRNPSVY